MHYTGIINKIISLLISQNVSVSYLYGFYNKVLDRVDVVRDLGVRLDSKLIFSQHINTITNKASRNLGLVMRTCKPFTKELPQSKDYYFAYVRSILDWSTVALSGHPNTRYILNELKIYKKDHKISKFHIPKTYSRDLYSRLQNTILCFPL